VLFNAQQFYNIDVYFDIDVQCRFFKLFLIIAISISYLSDIYYMFLSFKTLLLVITH